MISSLASAAHMIQRRFGGGSAAGQTLIEYGLLLSLIAVVAVVALLFLGPAASNLYSNTGQNLQ